QNRDTGFRPGLVYRSDDRLHIGAQAAARRPAAPCERHVVPDHLPHHVGRSARDVRRVRHDYDADVMGCLAVPGSHLDAARFSSFFIARPSLSSTSTFVRIMSHDERAPGSMCPTLRAPRNEARPRTASIGTVAAAADSALARRRAYKSSPPSFRVPSTGISTSSMVFICTSDFPRALTASIAAENACATPARVGDSGNVLPSAMNSVPYSGP